MTSATGSSTTSAATRAEAHALGVEAYVYLYPLLMMDATRRQLTNLPAGQAPGFGPMNAFHHIRAFPTAEFRAVVRPNFDTLYSVAWLDVAREPMVVSVPDTDGRYYLLPLYDMWTDAFAVPGSRTSGTGAGRFVVAHVNWDGAVPEGAELIEAPTPHVWVDRPHADQRARRLFRRPRGAGRLHGHAALAPGPGAAGGHRGDRPGR